MVGSIFGKLLTEIRIRIGDAKYREPFLLKVCLINSLSFSLIEDFYHSSYMFLQYFLADTV